MNEVERVKEICKKRKIPISRLEKSCGFSNGYIRGLKEGKMPSDRLYSVALFLGVSMEYLLTGSETSADPLSDDEQEMLSLFRSLSSDGRSELLSYARYKASTQESVEGKVG